MAFGFAPNGILQLLLTVFVPAVCVKVTRLNVTLLQLRVGEVVPLKFTVPPLALNVGVPDIVKLLEIEVVPLEAVKLPPDKLKVAVLKV